MYVLGQSESVETFSLIMEAIKEMALVMGHNIESFATGACDHCEPAKTAYKQSNPGIKVVVVFTHLMMNFKPVYVFCAFYLWWIYFLQSGALTEGTFYGFYGFYALRVLFSVIGGPCKRYAVTLTPMPSHDCLPGQHSAVCARGAAMCA
jgi:hypothetical protein